MTARKTIQLPWLRVIPAYAFLFAAALNAIDARPGAHRRKRKWHQAMHRQRWQLVALVVLDALEVPLIWIVYRLGAGSHTWAHWLLWIVAWAWLTGACRSLI